MAVTDLIPRIRSRIPVTRGSTENPHPLVSFHERMNRLFDDLWQDFDVPGVMPMSRPSPGFPHVEMTETDKELRVEAELPGLDEKNIELLLHDGVLTIRGERRDEREDKSRHVSERFYGRFERRIALPVEVQEAQVNASFQNGVLVVTLPKLAGAEQTAKRIPISSK